MLTGVRRRLGMLIGILAVIGFLSGCSADRWNDKELGGKWHLRSRETLPEGGSSNNELWYGSTRVARMVHATRYYGDDCVAYSSGEISGEERSFFVCSDRVPVRLGEESLATWDFGDAALQQQGVEVSSTAFAHGDQRVPIADAKRSALAQPRRSSE